jgi:hypothetical protein
LLELSETICHCNKGQQSFISAKASKEISQWGLAATISSRSCWIPCNSSLRDMVGVTKRQGDDDLEIHTASK